MTTNMPLLNDKPIRDIPLTKVNIIGEKYVHCFLMEDGSRVEVETTEEDYRQLGGLNPVNPSIEGGTWVLSMSKRLLDTDSGDLEEGQYFEDGGNIVAKLEDGIEHVKPTMEEVVAKRADIKVALQAGTIQKMSISSVPLNEIM